MSRRRSSSPMTCQNPACDFFLIEQGKDLVKNGRNAAGHQQYFCKHCRTYFTETKNTPFYRSRLKPCQIELICRLSQEKISMRGISRVTGHHLATIARYYRLTGEHASLLTATSLQDLGPERIELDEIWSFVRKKSKHCEDRNDQECGDWWTYTAIRGDTGLLIAHHAGKRMGTTCVQFLFCLFSRLRKPQPPARISITTDGNPQYLAALPTQCPESCIDYGQVIKHREGNRLVAVFREIVFGNPTIASISTSRVEGYNNKIRQRVSRFVRKTASFSKAIVAHTRVMDLFQFVSNFIEAKEGTVLS